MKVKNTSDWVIAILVVVCSVILFSALAVALSGTFIGGPSRIVEADFVDVTGISSHSQVKLSGASAGRVAGIRILTPEERLQAENPAYRIRLSLALSPSVPILREGAVASISSDTILSDKFVQIEDGKASAPQLREGAILTSITPTSFDQLVRSADTALVAVNELIGGAGGDAGDLLSEMRTLLAESRAVLSEVPMLMDNLHDVAGGAGGLISEAEALLGQTKEPLLKTISRLDHASESIDSLATRSERLIADNEHSVKTLMQDLRATSQNTKVATTYLKILALRLAQNPSHLVWGRTTPPPMPTEQEILSSPKP